MVSLDKNRRVRPYRSELCLTCCLDVHTGQAQYWHSILGGSALSALYKYGNVVEDSYSFPEFPLERLNNFAKCFKINVNIYKFVDLPMFKSRCRYRITIYLKLYKHHSSFVNNFWAYACERHFTRSPHANLRRLVNLL